MEGGTEAEMERREKTGSEQSRGTKPSWNKMGTSQVQQKPRSSEKALYCSQDQLQPSKGGFALRNPESTLPWIRTAAPCHSLGGELQVRPALTDFAKPEMSSASAPMLWEWTQ